MKVKNMINSFPDPYIKTNKKLNRNPLYRFLFKCGYLGTEDLYEYWIKNESKIIKLYKQEVDSTTFEEDVIEFKHKVIWSTCLGIFLRFEIKKYLRCNIDNKTDFSHVTTVYGDDTLSISEFNDRYNKMERISITDLRGTAIIKANFNNVEVYNVNFDYASLDGCTFDNVTFINCSFKSTNFSGTKIIDSTFDKDCTFYKNKFYNAVIKAEFNSDLIEVDIIKMKQKIITDKRIISNLKYPSYTVIISPSFVSNSNDVQITKQYIKQKRFNIDDINKYALIDNDL